MASETKKYRIMQKRGDNDFLTILPETSADNVTITSESIKATEVKGALEELYSKIEEAIEASGVISVNGRSGAVTLTKGDIGLGNVDNTADLAKPISTKTQAALDLKANLTDLDGFIKNTVDDLVNYYKKTETYTRTEVDQKISAIPKFKVSVVEQLPKTGEDATIYLVKSSKEESQNLYTEYIWADGKWEQLGTQTLDLSNYVTTDALNSKVAGYLPLTGGTLTGALTLSGAPSANLQAATKKYVDDTVAPVKTTADNAKSAAATAQAAAEAVQEDATANATEISKIKDGTTKVAKATTADTATSATSATTATRLAAGVKIGINGADVIAASASFNGSTAIDIPVVLNNTGVDAGSYTAVTVNAKGRVTAGAQVIEVGTSDQATPSTTLATGGLFFMEIVP